MLDLNCKLQMNLYKVHNLSMVHPISNVHVQYELEGTYLATMMDSMFISLPTALDVSNYDGQHVYIITNSLRC